MNNRIKVINIVGPLVIGGAENMVYELTKALDSSIVDSLLISIGSRTGSGLEKKVDNAGINIKYAGCNGTVTPSKLYRVYKIMKKFKPDVIHAHMSGVVYSIPWILTHKCKMVVTAHTTPNKAFNSRVTRILKVLAKMGKVTMVGVSEENAELMKGYYELDDLYVKHVNNGVDITKYYHKEHKYFTFINVGRLDENKNQQLIIECVKRLHDENENVRLILCGDGSLREKLESLVKQLKLTNIVTFTGNVDNVQDYLAVSDVYLQSSHREGLPLSVIEGMASRLPVITTNVGGMKNVVERNGFLVDDNDTHSYLEAMRTLMQDSNLKRIMGDESYNMTVPFSSTSMANKYTDIYKSLI